MNTIETFTLQAPIAATCPYLVLLLVIDPEEAARLLPLAVAIARSHNGAIIALRIIPPASAPHDNQLDPATPDPLAELTCDPIVRIQSMTRVAETVSAGICAVVAEQHVDLVLLGWHEDLSAPERLFGPPINDLLRDPPCDVAVVRLRATEPWQRLLLPVSGGPHTTLACDIAQALAENHDIPITVLYASDPKHPDDDAVRESLQELRGMPRVNRWLERIIPAEQAILSEVGGYQAVVMGIAGQNGAAESPVGILSERIMRQAPATLILACHRMTQEEALFQQDWQRRRTFAETVDRWFAENTFSSREFEDLKRLVALKREQGLTISLSLPALNEEATVGDVIGIAQQALVEQVPLLDEIVLIDGGSQDRTREIALSHGIPVYVHQEILPQ